MELYTVAKWVYPELWDTFNVKINQIWQNNLKLQQDIEERIMLEDVEKYFLVMFSAYLS